MRDRPMNEDEYADPWQYTDKDNIVLNCPHCGFKILHRVMGSTIDDPVGVPSLVLDGYEPFADPLRRFQLLKCRNCCEFTLIRQQKIVDTSTTEHWTEGEIVWPVINPSLNVRIPSGLRREHAEGMLCLRSGAYTAALVMVRRILEGVCSQFGFNNKTLVQNLSAMEQQGLIDGRLLEWAQTLRVVGNTAAHYTNHQVGREDAEEALSLAEALLEYLYVFSVQFEEFKKRNAEKIGPKP